MIAGTLRLSDLGGGSSADRLDDRERMLSSLNELQRDRFTLKRRQLENVRTF